MGCVGILGGYYLGYWDEKKLDGTSKDFFEVVAKSFTSHKWGWLGIVEPFSILRILAIN